MHKFKNKKFYGTSTIGEKGQIVIPKEARSAMKTKTGEKFLVFGAGDMLMMTKISSMEKIASDMARRLEAMQKIIKKQSK